MSRELPPPRQDDPLDPDRPDGSGGPPGTVRPTGPAPLVLLGLTGLFAGWALRGLMLRWDKPTPTVSWLAVGVTWFVAAVVGGIAYLTWRAVHRDRRRMTPQQGLARLVLGKTIARLGALACGGFAGTAISNLGVDGDLSRHALLTAAVATVGAAAALTAGLLLEHACRVPPADPESLP